MLGTSLSIFVVCYYFYDGLPTEFLTRGGKGEEREKKKDAGQRVGGQINHEGPLESSRAIVKVRPSAEMPIAPK